MTLLKVENLCKYYSKFRLENVSFSVEEGEIMGFIGRNGAGKTTTLKAILNFIKTDGGKIEYFGKDLLENEDEIKQNIGFASGGIDFYKQKKISTLSDITKKFYSNWDDEVFSTYLKEFNLDPDKKIKELSEGMKVKFNLAVALSHNAKLLILDEPTSGLDPVSRDEITTIFKSLKSKGVSILFSTHITSDLDKSADSITYIKKGHVVASMNKKAFEEKFDGNNLEEIILYIEQREDL